MRLKQSDLKVLQVLKLEEKESDYVGTSVGYLPDRTVKANVQPAESRRTIELYGERVKRMYRLLMNPPNMILPEERVIISGKLCEVVSAPEYSGHSAVIVEVVQDGTS